MTPDIGRLEEKLDTLRDAVTESTVAMREHVAQCKANWDLVQEHQTCLHGNGQPGMIKEVERLKTVSGIRSQAIWLVLGSAATIAIGVLGWLAQHAVAAFGG